VDVRSEEEESDEEGKGTERSDIQKSSKHNLRRHKQRGRRKLGREALTAEGYNPQDGACASAAGEVDAGQKFSVALDDDSIAVADKLKAFTARCLDAKWDAFRREAAVQVLIWQSQFRAFGSGADAAIGSVLNCPGSPEAAMKVALDAAEKRGTMSGRDLNELLKADRLAKLLNASTRQAAEDVSAAVQLATRRNSLEQLVRDRQGHGAVSPDTKKSLVRKCCFSDELLCQQVYRVLGLPVEGPSLKSDTVPRDAKHLSDQTAPGHERSFAANASAGPAALAITSRAPARYRVKNTFVHVNDSSSEDSCSVGCSSHASQSSKRSSQRSSSMPSMERPSY
jgi:hypothetical protein